MLDSVPKRSRLRSQADLHVARTNSAPQNPIDAAAVQSIPAVDKMRSSLSCGIAHKSAAVGSATRTIDAVAV